MSAISSMGQVGLKIRPNMAFRYLKALSASPLASTRHIFHKRTNILRHFSAVTIIPIDGYKHAQDVPSERVLSRLSIFEPSGTSQEAQRQEKEEAEKSARRRQQEEAQKRDKNTATGDSCPVADGGCGGGGCTTEDQSEYEGHGSTGPDTRTGTDASVPDCSGG